MRFILTLMISFQVISAPVFAAGVGEVKEFSPKEYLKTIMAEQEAKNFEAKVKQALTMVETGKANSFIKDQLSNYSKEDQATMKSWLAESPVVKMSFKETAPGSWKGKIGKHVVSFSLVDLYEEKIKIDGEAINLKGLSLAQLENKLTDIIQPKTTFLRTLSDQLFIADAEAALFLIAVVALLVAVIWAAVKITGSSKENKSIDQIIAGDLQKCQDSKYDKSSYNDTYEKAEDLAESQAGLSIKSRFMQLLTNEMEDSSCMNVFESSQVIANQYSEAQKTVICKNLEQLASCMNDFVQTHVKDESVRTPKENYVKFLKKGDKDFKAFKASKQ